MFFAFTCLQESKSHDGKMENKDEEHEQEDENVR